MRRRLAVLAATCLAAATPLPAVAQVTSEAQHVINLADVEITALIDDVAMLTGYTFIVHPSVSGRVTVSSQTELSTGDLFQVFLSTLRVQGYSAIPDGQGVYRIVPEESAAAEGALGGRAPSGFVTQAFKLDHFSAVEAAKMVKPLLGAQGRVVASPASNILIVVEYGSNMGTVRSLVNSIDLDDTVTRTLALKAVPVAEMESILNGLESASGAADRNGVAKLSVIASPASNSIILRGDPVSVERAAALVAELDTQSPLQKDTRVMRLNHADAVLMEPILRQIAETETARAGEAGVATIIAIHEPTNSVIVSAAPETVTAIQGIVEELDFRPKQVLVEAIIVEVSDTLERELGLQFLVSGDEGNVPFASSTFSSAAPNLLALAGAIANVDLDADGTGSSLFEEAATASLLGLTGGTFGFGGQSGDTLFGVVLNAIQDDEDSNLLSKPTVTTLDNNEAVFSVGQEIPITSGAALGDANINPFVTVERREVGIILTVMPRVGTDGTVRLDINQEVSSVDSVIGTSVTPDFILDQRVLQTSVVVDDGEMIVLGGLIEAQDLLEVEKVPLLGDIPAVGRLFQNELKQRSNTNLMVFIRPTILHDRDDVRTATGSSFQYIRGQQLLANGGNEPAIDQFAIPPLSPEANADTDSGDLTN
ncbi:MAG: type II secretion system secretin GspD [Pseudomonadota bacterium]